jgi:hypothetical protein
MSSEVGWLEYRQAVCPEPIHLKDKTFRGDKAVSLGVEPHQWISKLSEIPPSLSRGMQGRVIEMILTGP